MGSLGNWFKGIRGKLLLQAFLPIITLIGLANFSYFEMSKLSATVEKAANVRLPLATYAGDMDASINTSIRMMWSVYMAGEDLAERNKALNQTKVEVGNFEAAYREYLKLP